MAASSLEHRRRVFVVTTPKLSLSRMEEYCAKASEGPWFCGHGEGKGGLTRVDDGRDDGLFPFELEVPDAEFVVNARSDFPALLSWAKRAREFIEAAERGFLSERKATKLLSEFGE